MQPAEPDFDARYFRGALGQFTTGITVITTCAPDGRPIGFTANSFNSVSLSPPMVLWSLGLHAGCLPVFRDNTHYAVNILASEQLELSQRFGARVIDDVAEGRLCRFEGVDYSRGVNGAPILDGCCAWFECFNRSQYEEGDHLIFVGQVERCGVSNRDPLVFQDGQYRILQPNARARSSTTRGPRGNVG
ncbi:MAG: flavin reductase family protein [Pigmentiphaga sp.]